MRLIAELVFLRIENYNHDHSRWSPDQRGIFVPNILFIILDALCVDTRKRPRHNELTETRLEECIISRGEVSAGFIRRREFRRVVIVALPMEKRDDNRGN